MKPLFSIQHIDFRIDSINTILIHNLIYLSIYFVLSIGSTMRHFIIKFLLILTKN